MFGVRQKEAECDWLGLSDELGRELVHIPSSYRMKGIQSTVKNESKSERVTVPPVIVGPLRPHSRLRHNVDIIGDPIISRVTHTLHIWTVQI